jgi:hypothetical protein
MVVSIDLGSGNLLFDLVLHKQNTLLFKTPHGFGRLYSWLRAEFNPGSIWKKRLIRI